MGGTMSSMGSMGNDTTFCIQCGLMLRVDDAFCTGCGLQNQVSKYQNVSEESYAKMSGAAATIGYGELGVKLPQIDRGVCQTPAPS